MEFAVHAFITDDDAFSCNYLKDLLEDNFPHLQLEGTAATIRETRAFLASHRIDLLFLDVELPDGQGFDLLSSMEEVDFEVIITTAHSQYALDAIRHSALDYLIKPFELPELEHAIIKFVKKKIHSRAESSRSLEGKQPASRKIPLPASEGYVFIEVNNIIHVEADRAYSVFHIRDGSQLLVSKPMKEYEERLIRNNFFRVHKSYIINLGEISRYIRGEGGYVVMSNDAVLPVARAQKDNFLKISGCV